MFDLEPVPPPPEHDLEPWPPAVEPDPIGLLGRG